MATIKPKKLVKELEKQLRAQPDNLVLRLKLAAAYREVERRDDAVSLYRSVAVAYHEQGRLAQAIAVCRSVLELEPSQRETQVLLAELDRMKSMLQRPPPPSDVPSLAGARPSTAQASGDGPGQSPIPSLRDPVEQASASASSPPPSPPEPGREREAGPPSRRGRRGHVPLPASGASSRAALAEPPTELPREPARDEFAVNSGLTPHSNPALGAYRTRPGERTRPPVPGRTTPAELSRSQNAAGPFIDSARLRRNRRSSAIDRSSAYINTPTPLPIPLALHEAVAEDSIDEILAGSRRDFPPMARGQEDDEAPTRIAEDPAESARTAPPPRRAQTPPPLRRAPTPPPLPPAARTKRPATPPPSPLHPSVRPPPSSGFDDEAPTRIASDSLWPDPDPDTLVPQRGDAAARAEVPYEPEPSRRQGPLPEELLPYQRSVRLLDVHPPWSDGTTRSRERGEQDEQPIQLRQPQQPEPGEESDGESTRVVGEVVPAASDTPSYALDTSPTAVKQAPRRPARSRAESSLELSQAFDRDFGEAMEGIGPDGSAIEGPLQVFSELPDEALGALARGMRLRTFKRGEVIVREGALGDACFIIASGDVRVLKLRHSGAKASHVELARLGAGALFGEFALLGDRKRHATVQAVTDCEIHEISRAVLDDLTTRHADVAPALQQIYRRRLLSTLMTTAPFFQPLEAERRAEFLAKFRPMRCEAGQQIVREGERAGGLYLILLGTVEITRRTAPSRSVVVATLTEGAYFGEMSLLKGAAASASVTAVGPVELAVLSPHDFYGVMSEHPTLWAELRQEAHRRALATSDILSDEAGVV